MQAMKKKTSLSTLSAASRCAIYCRFSDQDADSKGAYSTNDAQADACRRFIEQAGAQLIALYADESKTGTNLKRPGWQKLLEAGKAGTIDTVVVTYTDRLARGEQFTIATYLLAQVGVSVVCALEHFGEGLAGVMQRQMSMMISGLWPAITSEKTRAKLTEMVRQGYWPGGKRRFFGLRPEPVEVAGASLRAAPKRLVPVPEEAEVVREALAVFVASGSLRSASALLEDASGRPWTDHATRGLLSSPLLVGRMVWGEVDNPAFCPPIVELKTWEAAQRLFASRTKGQRGVSAPKAGEPLWLLGRAYCQCGRRMTMYGASNRHGSRYNYYRCPASPSRTSKAIGEGVCTMGDVSAKRIHEVLVGEIVGLAKTPWRMRLYLEEVAKSIEVSPDIEREATLAGRRVKALAQQERKLVEAISLAHPDAIAPLTARLGTVAVERAQAQARLESLGAELAKAKSARPNRAQLEETLGKFSRAWEVATPEERAELMQLFIARVDVRATGLDVAFFEAAQREGSRGGKLSALAAAGALSSDLPSLSINTIVRSPRVLH